MAMSMGQNSWTPKMDCVYIIPKMKFNDQICRSFSIPQIVARFNDASQKHLILSRRSEGQRYKMAHFHHVWLVVAPVLKNISPISGDGKQCSNTQNHQSDVNHPCLLVKYPLHPTLAINELLFHKTVPPAELVRKLHRIEQGTPETSEAKVAPSDEGKIHSWIMLNPYIHNGKKNT